MSHRICVATSAVLVAGLAAPARAADSTWYVCHGIADVGAASDASRQYLAASVLEHRNATGDGRIVTVTLLKGMHVARGGTVLDSDHGVAHGLRLRSVEGRRAQVFAGTLHMDFKKYEIELRGSLDPTYGVVPGTKRVPLKVRMRCEYLDDHAIPDPAPAAP